MPHSISFSHTSDLLSKLDPREDSYLYSLVMPRRRRTGWGLSSFLRQWVLALKVPFPRKSH